MADVSDVENALVAAASAALTGPTGASILAHAVNVDRGWPNSDALDAALAQGVVTITVAPMDGMVRNTTRYEPVPQVIAEPPCTLAATVAGSTATFSGTCAVGQVAGVSYGGQVWAYAVQGTDTPASVTAVLATLAGGTASGAVIRLPTNQPVLARAMMPATTSTENERLDQGFSVIVWCPDYASRDMAGSAISAALAAVRFLPLADGTTAWVRRHGDRTFDTSQNANLYRRDLTFLCEYGITQQQLAPRVLFPELTLAANAGPVVKTLVS